MFRLIFLALTVVLATTGMASAALLITIDRANQRMTVVGDTAVYMWPVSTGAPGYDTPAGSYTPFRMEEEHFSKEWDDAPMPHSIFFTKRGHAIHGTNSTAALGRPVSHGCVRLDPEHAAFLFNLVKTHGLKSTRVVVTGAGMEVANNEERYSLEPFIRDPDLRPVRNLLRMLDGLARR